MDHADVRERLESAVLSPGKLAAIDADPTALGEEFRSHLASCASCVGELRALRETAALLALAAPDDLHAPSDARSAVLRAIRETGVRRSESRTAVARTSTTGRLQGRRASLLAALGLAAAAVLLIAAVASGLQLRAQRDEAQGEARELAEMAMTSDRLLRDASTKTAVLRDKDGRAAGTVTYNVAKREVVVVTDALPAPPSGHHYDCLVGQGDQWSRVGWMHWSAGLAYWAGGVGSSFTDGGSTEKQLVVIVDDLSAPGIRADL